jgi:hypothetical protein
MIDFMLSHHQVIFQRFDSAPVGDDCDHGNSIPVEFILLLARQRKKVGREAHRRRKPGNDFGSS